MNRVKELHAILIGTKGRNKVSKEKDLLDGEIARGIERNGQVAHNDSQDFKNYEENKREGKEKVKIHFIRRERLAEPSNSEHDA